MDKTKLAEEKLASVSKLEEENANLKAALDAANKEVSRLKNDKIEDLFPTSSLALSLGAILSFFKRQGGQSFEE